MAVVQAALHPAACDAWGILGLVNLGGFRLLGNWLLSGSGQVPSRLTGSRESSYENLLAAALGVAWQTPTAAG